MSKKRDGGLDKTGQDKRGQLKFRWMFGQGVDVELALEAKLGKTAGWRTFFSGACLRDAYKHLLVPPHLLDAGRPMASIQHCRHGSMDGMEPIHTRGRGARFYQVPGLKVPMQHRDAEAVLASLGPEGS